MSQLELSDVRRTGKEFDASLIGCHECDLLQREVALPKRGVATCARCGAQLYRSHPNSLERTLALSVTALVLFTIANTFPVVGLKLQGQVIDTTLFQVAQTLWNQDMKLVGALVFVTTILMPALQIFALVYLLLPIRFGRVSSHFAFVFRVFEVAREWGMVEVFILGVLVSLVKLAHLAGVISGIGLWSLGALMFVMAAIATVFDERELWMYAKVKQQ